MSPFTRTNRYASPPEHADISLLARAKVCEIYQVRSPEHNFQVEDFYTVWSVKVLQNWKALVSTDVEDGIYVEVTFNGDKNETYVDVYEKVENILIEIVEGVLPIVAQPGIISSGEDYPWAEKNV